MTAISTVLSESAEAATSVKGASPSLGLGFLCCKRTHIAALALAHFFKYRPPNTFLHAYVDHASDMEAPPPELVRMLQYLKEGGYLESLVFFDRNVGLELMVSWSITELAAKGYDYIARFEDDMLLGPDLLSNMMDCFELSSEDARPLGLLGGQITAIPSSLRALRMRHVGRYIVGIHGVDNLEGLTMLRRSMEETRPWNARKYNWNLDHPRAYNNSWLNRFRTCGFEGGTIVDPIGLIQHIGHRTTVPFGSPVTPARTWNTKEIIKLPVFEWEPFVNTGDVPAERIYASKIVRQLVTGMESDLAIALMSAFSGSLPDWPLPELQYSPPYSSLKNRTEHFQKKPSVGAKVGNPTIGVVRTIHKVSDRKTVITSPLPVVEHQAPKPLPPTHKTLDF